MVLGGVNGPILAGNVSPDTSINSKPFALQEFRLYPLNSVPVKGDALKFKRRATLQP